MYNKAASFLLAMFILCSAAFAQDESRYVNLPITRAVLFSSGVGYFEHEGVVAGDAVMRIMFKTEQINDVLKSMVLRDLDGGQVRGVTYAANDPLERALKSFAVDISGNPGMAELLDQLRGAAVIVHAPERVDGTILSVEQRQREVEKSTLTEFVLNIVTSGGIKSVPLRTGDSIQFADEKLQDELNRALSLLAGSRDTEQKAVDIRFNGSGERRVMVGYLVETPVWKTSYRLDLSNDDRPFMQGWAIVENTSNNDWERVQLSLVSGRPISFIQDLYTPLYMPRPVVRPRLYASLTPQMYKGGVEMDMDDMAERGLASRMRVAEPSSAGRGGGGALYGAPAADAAMGLEGAGVSSLAQAESIGELFRFTIAHPVEMARRRSAMLPIVNEGVTAEKLSIYNANVLAGHPLNAVYLTNSTDLKLLSGPVTVFDGGSYAGDAQIDHLSPGEKRLLSYAVDLDVTADSSNKSNSRIANVSINRGVLRIDHAWEYEQSYTFANKSSREKTLIVEHPFNTQRALAEPAGFEEKTPEVYRFRVSVPAGKTQTLNVVEKQTTYQTIALLNQPISAFQQYVTSSSRAIKPAVREALEGVVLRKNRLSEAQQMLSDLESQLRQIIDGQSRLRDNLQAVGSDSQLGKRYLSRLAEEEDQIEELQRKIAAARDEVNQRRRELEDYLANLNV